MEGVMENATLMRSSVLSDKIEDVLAYFPENPLTHPLARLWIWMTTSVSEYVLFTYIPVLMHEGLFILGVLPTFLFQFIPFMKRFKIQHKHEEVPIDQWRAFKLVAFNHFCTQVPMIVLPPTMKQWFNIPYSWDSMPRWYVILAAVYFCAMCEDTWHYFLHRLAHTKPFYKLFHKVHHTFQAPFGLTAEYSHPVEVIVLGSGFFAGLIFVCSHMSIMFAWIVVRILVNVDGHCGYDVPFMNPLHLMPFYGGSRFHDFHHSNHTGNFSSVFTWWDWLLGTDKAYRRYLKQKAAGKLAKED